LSHHCTPSESWRIQGVRLGAIQRAGLFRSSEELCSVRFPAGKEKVTRPVQAPFRHPPIYPDPWSMRRSAGVEDGIAINNSAAPTVKPKHCRTL